MYEIGLRLAYTVDAMPELRSCRLSYKNLDGIKHSVEVTAETLYEAANLTIKVTANAPGTTHSISNAVLAAGLSRAVKIYADSWTFSPCAGLYLAASTDEGTFHDPLKNGKG